MAAIIKHLSSPFEGFALFAAQKLSEKEASVQSVGAYACGCNMRIQNRIFCVQGLFLKRYDNGKTLFDFSSFSDN